MSFLGLVRLKEVRRTEFDKVQKHRRNMKSLQTAVNKEVKNFNIRYIRELVTYSRFWPLLGRRRAVERLIERTESLLRLFFDLFFSVSCF